MVVSRARRLPSNGTICVAGSLAATPFIEAWSFDQAAGWISKYAAVGTPPGGAAGRAVRFAPPDNNRLLYSGSSTALLYNFPFTFDGDDDGDGGFGSASTTATSGSNNPVDIWFNKTEDRILVSGDQNVSEYSYANDAIGSQIWSLSTAGNSRAAKYINNDEQIIIGFVNSSGETWRIYDRNGDSAPTAFNVTGPFGTPVHFSFSPIANDDGSHPLSCSIGTNLAITHVTGNSFTTPAFFSAGAGTAHAGMWDPYGRLITMEGTNPKLNIYELNPTTKAFTLLDSDSGMNSHSTVNWMEYDHDQDILFLGTDTSPYLEAYRMGGKGFVSKYTSLSGGDIPTDEVIKISLAFDEKFKQANP